MSQIVKGEQRRPYVRIGAYVRFAVVVPIDAADIVPLLYCASVFTFQMKCVLIVQLVGFRMARSQKHIRTNTGASFV